MDYKAKITNPIELETFLRNFTEDKLLALNHILNAGTAVVSTATIADKMFISQKPLGGITSSLIRTKINNEPVVLKIAKTKDRRTIIKYNEKLASKQIMKNAVNTILNDFK